jgi:predicted nucleic acid-binding protein
MIVFLDTGVLGLLSSPNDREQVREIQQWVLQLLARSVYVISSEICDYEVRRSLILQKLTRTSDEGINNLDSLASLIDFLPVTKTVLKKAAQLWAQIRIQGLPTADSKNIDADIIIAATCQIIQEEYPGQKLIVATSNVKHLSRFLEAKQWQEIKF